MKKTKKIVLLSVLIFAIFSVYAVCYAASATISASSTSVNIGDSVTISVNVTAATWNLHAGGAVSGDYVDATEDTNNTSFTKTLSFTPSSAGTHTVSLTGDITDENGSTINVNDSVTITASEPESEQTPEQTQEPEQSTPATQEDEPKFSDVSKTVYSTTEVNLRSSWSTDSSATRIPKDTELLLTGTSTDKVNGYVWYRVTYNGQLKYIASQYITETKPQTTINLKTIDIDGVELKPAFSNDVTEYTATIKNFTEKEIKVTATAEDSKTTVKVDGNKNIKFGENTITVTAKAEDGTEKKFTIKLTNEQVEAFGLKTLKINDKAIKGFAVDKYEYTFDFSDLDKLDIKAEANEEGAKIEITGNENLKVGKNVITIVVTSKDGKTKATYKITANKTIAEKVTTEIDYKYIAVAGVVALATLILIIILIVKYKRDSSDSTIDNYNEGSDDDDYLDVETDKNNNKFYYDDFDEEDNYNNSKEENSIKDNNYDDSEEDSDEEDETDDEDDYNDSDEEKSTEYNNEDNNSEKITDEQHVEEKKPRKFGKYTVDDLYNNDDDDDYIVEELPKRKNKGKGKHSI